MPGETPEGLKHTSSSELEQLHLRPPRLNLQPLPQPSSHARMPLLFQPGGLLLPAQERGELKGIRKNTCKGAAECPEALSQHPEPASGCCTFRKGSIWWLANLVQALACSAIIVPRTGTVTLLGEVYKIMNGYLNCMV